MESNRKEFIKKAAFSFMGMAFLPQLFPNSSGDRGAVIMHENEGETYWIGTRNSPVTIKVAKDKQGNTSMSFCSELIAPGESVPIHKHLNEDELIFIHEGEGVLVHGDEETIVKKGSVAFVPKGIWHSLKNSGSEDLIMIFSYSPAGFEGYFRELGTPAGIPWKPKTAEEFKKLDEKWGIVYK